MKRIVFSIPEPMRVRFIDVVRDDGRSQGEILRALLSGFIQDSHTLARIKHKIETPRR